MSTIVIGLGNPVRSDDGVGLHIARAVRERIKGRGLADVEELWAGGMRLAEAMSGYSRALVVDAMATGGKPGEIKKFELGELAGCRSVACIHDATLPEALEFWRMAGEPVPDVIEIFGVEAKDVTTLSENLTGEVSQAVPEAVRRVLEALGLAEGDR